MQEEEKTERKNVQKTHDITIRRFDNHPLYSFYFSLILKHRRFVVSHVMRLIFDRMAYGAMPRS